VAHAKPFSRLIIDRDVPVVMRDGVALYADIYYQDDRPRPAILSRLPYNKDSIEAPYIPEPRRAIDAGFVLVVQDTRGRGASGGEFYPFRDEAADGYDTVEWVAAQSWCDGNVGMTGASYFGATQWLAASLQPPHLKAIFPIMTAHDYHQGWTYQGGAFSLGFNLTWTLWALAPDTLARQVSEGHASPQELQELLDTLDQTYAIAHHLPLSDLAVLNKTAPYYRDWIAHEVDGDFWQRWSPCSYHARVCVPAFHVGGWYDLFLGGTLGNYLGMRQHGASEVVQQGQYLLVGPWTHGTTTGTFAERDFGALTDANIVDLTDLQLRWFTHWLCPNDAQQYDEPRVRIFTMGTNQWRDASDWPLPETEWVRYYLRGGGDANSVAGDGRLDREAPSLEEPIDTFRYDPRDPVPTWGGPTFLPGLTVAANAGPRDQHQVETRSDVLVYTSPPLTEDLDVTGPIRVTLYASTTAVDTDFTAKLVDLFPDGRAFNLTEGIIRARFRNGMHHVELVEPGVVTEYVIDACATSNVFRDGHRIRLEISSSNFPRFDRNTNTGHPLGIDGPTDLISAVQCVYHTPHFPSHITLPVIPK
jgi:uncharacterized protein